MQSWHILKPHRQDQQKGTTLRQQWQATSRPRRCFSR
jgi:hypothetical protein